MKTWHLQKDKEREKKDKNNTREEMMMSLLLFSSFLRLFLSHSVSFGGFGFVEPLPNGVTKPLTPKA